MANPLHQQCLLHCRAPRGLCPSLASLLGRGKRRTCRTCRRPRRWVHRLRTTASTSTRFSLTWDGSLDRNYKIYCQISVDLQIYAQRYPKVARERERSSLQDQRIRKLNRVSYADWAVMHRLLIGSMDKVDGHAAVQGSGQIKFAFQKELVTSDTRFQ